MKYAFKDEWDKKVEKIDDASDQNNNSNKNRKSFSQFQLTMNNTRSRYLQL